MAFDDVKPPGFPHALGPAVDGAAIVLDGAISPPSRALWVAAAGDVAVTFISGKQLTIPSVPAGTRLDVSVIAVRTAGTTVATPTTNIQVWR